MTGFIFLQYVYIDDTQHMERALSRNKLKVVSQTRSCTDLDDILFSKHDFNGHKIVGLEGCGQHVLTMRSAQFISPDKIAEKFGASGEGLTYFTDTITGDVVTANNFYGCRAVSMLQHNLNRFESLHWLKEVAFPGTFDWKYVEFPAGDNTAYGKVFHRGTCFVIRFLKEGVSSGIKPAQLRKQARNKQRLELTPTEQVVSDKLHEMEGGSVWTRSVY